MSEKRKAKKIEKQFEKELSLGIAQEVERYGRASTEHFSAYPELDKISQSKINPDYQETNTQQQAGFSAEVKHVARDNAESIIDGKDKRIARTDNVGSPNHPKYDTVEVDAKGNPLRDSNGEYIGGVQQKSFSKPENYDKLYGKDYEHYKETPIDIPPDHYDEVVGRWDNKIKKLHEQKENLINRGESAKADVKQQEIDRIEDTKERLHKSKVSNDDAIEARRNPEWSTAKDIAKVSHRAGVEGAKHGAVIVGGISGVQNLVAICKGEKDWGEALLDTGKSTAKSAAVGYGAGFTISTVGGALQSSKNALMQNLGKGAGPVVIVQAGRILATNVVKLAKGELSGEEFVMSLSKESVALASSAYGAGVGAVVGTAILPGLGTVVGGVIGAMLSSMLVNSMFGQLQTVMAQTKLSNQQREMIHAYCQQLIKEEEEKRKNIEIIFNAFYEEKERAFLLGFQQINASLQRGEDISSGLSTIANSMGFSLGINSVEEFRAHRESGEAFQLGR